MKILFVTSSSPFPPHTGGQQRSFHLLKYLAGKGSVTLVSAANPNVYQDHLASFQEYCEKVFFADPRKDRLQGEKNSPFNIQARLVKLFKGLPWLLEDYATQEIYERILESQPEQFDLIVIRYPVMAYFFLTDKKLRGLLDRVVIDVDDVSTILMEREIARMPLGYRKLRHSLDLFFLKGYFKKLQDARLCFTVSQMDKNYLEREGFSKRVSVIPNMIEVSPLKLETSIRPSTGELMFCGMLSYPPNQEAAVYFAEEIFPLIRRQIPEAKFTIVGKHAPRKVIELGHLAGVEMAGYVPSMDPYYEKSTVVVCPLLNGAGTRIKILDAMAHSRPVVSTSIGAEGLEVTDGEEILIADDPESFAAKCVELLNNPTKRVAIADKAYKLVKEKYDVSVFERKMDVALEPNLCARPQIEIPSPQPSGPIVSVILPTYNRASYLKKALESVCAQSFKDWELIVVDDGSTDETRDVVVEARLPRPSQEGEETSPLRSKIVYLHQPNSGVAAARNAGISRSSGKYIAFLDDDDEWLPEKLKTQVEFMQSHPEIGMSYTQFKITRKEGPKAGQSSVFPEILATTFKEMLESFFIPLPTVMIRKPCLESVGGFNSLFGISEDQDLWFRFVQRWKISAIPQVLTRTFMDERRHLGHDRIEVHQHMIAVLKNLKLQPEYQHFKPLMRKRSARLSYAIARDYLDRNQYGSAAGHFARALGKDPLVGLGVRRPGEAGLGLILRLVKSYAAIPACLMKGLLYAHQR